MAVAGGPRLVLALVGQQGLPGRVAHRVQPRAAVVPRCAVDQAGGVGADGQRLAVAGGQPDAVQAQPVEGGVPAGRHQQLVHRDGVAAVELER